MAENKAVELSQQSRQEIDAWITKYPVDQKRAAVIAALHIIQRENKGYLTEPLMDAVADYLELPKIAVYEVVTFYGMYDVNPVGRHKVKICNNISCMLRGSEKILDHVQKFYDVEIGGTTKDGLFTLYETECLAACGGAPALQVDDQVYHENLTTATIDKLIADLKAKGASNGQ